MTPQEHDQLQEPNVDNENEPEIIHMELFTSWDKIFLIMGCAMIGIGIHSFMSI